MNRRQLLLCTIAVILHYYFPWFGNKTSVESNSGDSFDVVIDRGQGLFSDPIGARELGRRYMALYPEENGSEDLLKELASMKGGTSTTGDSDFLRNSLARKTAKDFREDNIVIIDGWVLARAEAQACSLTCLS